MHVIYKITYLPHLEANTPPYYYVGSKCNYNDKRKYLGSLSSVQQTWWSEGHKAGSWWKAKTKKNPELFKFEILEEFDDNVSAKEMILHERQYHDELDILSETYFNFSKATRGFCGCKRSPESKDKVAKSTKRFWNSTEGQAKKLALIENNKKIKPTELSMKWQDPTFIEKMKKRKPRVHTTKSREVLSNSMKLYHSLKEKKAVIIDGVWYKDANEASDQFRIHPTNIRRRCRLAKYTNWNYA